MKEGVYRHDVHGSAVGIITFAAAGELDLAERIAGAAIADLWNQAEGRFYYRRYRRRRLRLTLMRWCQAWMAHALLALVRRRAQEQR